jgi:membrane fusion protein, heavy metal efflux system
MKKYLHTIMLVALIVVIAGAAGCDNVKTEPEASIVSKAAISDGGEKIVFPAGSSSLARFSVMTAAKGSITTSVIAPARVVASIPAGSESNRVLLFDSPDVTTLYSQYRQSKANVDLTSKNLARIRDMLQNQGATAKDLNQAEADVSNARAVQTEMEGRLRSAGFNPRELDETPAGSVWIMSDVSESQLTEVDKGEAVDVYFNAFPNRKFEGHAAALGDVLDPVTRSVKVRITMRNPQEKILPGMFAKVDFGDPKNNVVVIPLESVFTVEGRDYVFLRPEPATFIRRQVVLSAPVGNRVIVLSGISAGETVVTSGAMLLKGLSFNY